MTKFAACTIGAVLAVAVATVVVIKHQSEIRHLSEDTHSAEEQRGQIPTLPAENIRPSNASERTSGFETRTNEPLSRELLRLRGEVARLRHEQSEAENLRQEKEEEINKLRGQIQQFSGQPPGQVYNGGEIDTPDFRPSTTTNDVLAGLQRVDAKILAYQDKFGQQYIRANIFPKEALTTNANVAVSMEFYFEDGKLTSTRSQRTSQP